MNYDGEAGKVELFRRTGPVESAREQSGYADYVRFLGDCAKLRSLPQRLLIVFSLRAEEAKA